MGAIALVERGFCTFGIKTVNAQNAGAAGILIVNNVDALGDDSRIIAEATNIPALFVDDDIGAQLLSLPNTFVHITVERVEDAGVPTPATLTLLGLSLAGLGRSRRRK